MNLRNVYPVLMGIVAVLAMFTVDVKRQAVAKNMALEEQFAGPATTTVELSNGTRFKVAEFDGRRFLVAEFAGVGAGMSDFIPSTCETYVTKPDGTREYGTRFNCPATH